MHDNAVTFVITLVATFVATLPAVWLGIKIERSHAARDVRVEGRNKRDALKRVSRESGGILYSCRDWLNALEGALMDGRVLKLSDRHPSIYGMKWLLQSGYMTEEDATVFARLVDEVCYLYDLVLPYAGRAVPSPLAEVARDKAFWTGRAVQHWINQSIGERDSWIFDSAQFWKGFGPNLGE